MSLLSRVWFSQRLAEIVITPIGHTISMHKRPKVKMCYLCGREYGTASLEIHQKQCKKKWLQEEEKKPPHKRRPLPDPPDITANILAKVGSGNNLDISDLTSDQLREAQNEAAYQNFNDNTMVRCEFCSRTFLPEKLEIHNRSCRADNVCKKVGEGGRSGHGAATEQKKDLKKETKRPIQPEEGQKATYSGSFSSNRKLSKAKLKQAPLHDSPIDGEATSKNLSAMMMSRLDGLENIAKSLLKEIQHVREDLRRATEDNN